MLILNKAGLLILNKGGCYCESESSSADAGNLNIYSLNSSFVLKKPPSDGELG